MKERKKTFLAPYTSTEDPRFAWLEGEFLQYLNDWNRAPLTDLATTLLMLEVVCFCHGRHTRGPDNNLLSC